MISLKSKREIELMRDAGRVVAEVLAELRLHCRAGVTTRELDRVAEAKTAKAGAKPLFKGYRGFPRALCTSVNQQVVHGIPGDYVLKDGDIVSMDFGALYKGYCGDAAITVPIGAISLPVANLLRVTEECLYRGIEQMVVGNHLVDVSRAIQLHGESHGYSMVRDLGGHGIGRKMHEDPMVLNYVTDGRGPKLKSGLVLAVEPMVNAGAEDTYTLSDGWTVVTKDRKPSAHFEHTVAVTENGPDILTKLG
ncbi:MAG: type I methionyl aminopeptidase [Acidobacteriota bacterium]|jgi:methionyl aminopeptidase|nr:type I methionyl aminopeptidase [Acidobacteriota bacterium]